MSTLRPHTVIPLLILFIGFRVPANEGKAHERHAGAQANNAAKTTPHHLRGSIRTDLNQADRISHRRSSGSDAEIRFSCESSAAHGVGRAST
jgi:hypothetical protein